MTNMNMYMYIIVISMRLYCNIVEESRCPKKAQVGVPALPGGVQGAAQGEAEPQGDH